MDKPKFKKGDAVQATADHEEGMSGMSGVVKIVRNGPYYGVQMDGEDDVHKWLAEDELVPDGEMSLSDQLRRLTKIVKGG